ncbi:hypothetical protein M2352_003688 [Azospirillum fermentarium]|uniref:hypothetical protein n=1 Tax=Azospirillum fermentarium TaxID=1233114 RepID=UPI002226A374|nr:hypothetical protein [Azospirillum fermentarium]MCW2248054.1 hypothetical protein [Azospirillum fermentarium]
MNKPFDFIAPIANFAKESGIPLNSTEFISSFMENAENKVKEALDDKTLLYGNRVESLFEATVISLGKYNLFKTEDIGRVHSSNQLRAPDFRIVLNDGDQWLVEVKSVFCRDPLRQKAKLTPAYLNSIQSYADLVKVPLKIAFFWSKWNFWTLISPEQFKTKNGGLVITMGDAMKANLMGKLGDVHIGTIAPLRLRFEADQEKSVCLYDDGKAEFTIQAVKIFSDTTELTDSRDQKLAWILMHYGDWVTDGARAIRSEDVFQGIEFCAYPQEISEEGFNFVGIASRIFSNYFTHRTVEGDQVIQLKGEAAPEWFSPLSEWDFKNSKLPLWLVKQIVA